MDHGATKKIVSFLINTLGNLDIFLKCPIAQQAVFVSGRF